MTKEEPRTPANTGTSQTDDPSPQTQTPGVQQDCQSGKQSPTEKESPFEKEYASNTRKETSSIQGAGSGTTSFVSVPDSQPLGLGDYYHKKKGTFQAERELPHSPLTQHPETRVQRDAEKMQNLKEGHHGSPYSVDTGSERLRPQSVRRKSVSNTRPCSVQPECGTNRPMNVPIPKSGDINRSERNTIRTGEEPLNPCSRSGTVCRNEDQIEEIPEKAPKDQTFTNPNVTAEPKTLSDSMTRSSETDSSDGCCLKCLHCCLRGCGRQFMKAPIFQIISIYPIVSSIISFMNSEWNKDLDIPICTLLFFIGGIFIALFARRGKYSKCFKTEEASHFRLFNFCSVCCACCRRPETVIERRSRYPRRVKNNMDGTFKERREGDSDTSSSSNQQMATEEGDSDTDLWSNQQMATEDISDRESRDDLPKVIQADVHVSAGSAGDYDEYVCEHYGQGLACSCPLNTPERKLDSELKTEQPSVLSHSIMADDPETAMNPAGTPSSERRCETQSGVSQSPYKKRSA